MTDQTRPSPASPAPRPRPAADQAAAPGPKPTTRLWCGPYTYVEFHRFYRAVIAGIDPRHTNLLLYIHSTMREWLGAIEVEDGEVDNRIGELLRAGIASGKVVPIMDTRRRQRTSTTVLDAPPPWVPGPYHRA
jgi:hypothetical protein